MRFIVWSKILLLAFLLCFLTRGVKADGCYTPKRDIGDEAGLAADICSINDGNENTSFRSFKLTGL